SSAVFTVAASVTPVSAQSSAVVSRLASDHVSLALTGVPVLGEDWTVTLDGVSYTYKVGTSIGGFTGDPLTLIAVAAGLLSKIPDPYVVALSPGGAALVLQRTTPFTAAF